jgi:RNA polymerase sigma-70 factor, ECF subfamily
MRALSTLPAPDGGQWVPRMPLFPMQMTPVALESAEVTDGAHVLDPAGLGDHTDRLFRAAWALCGSRPDAEDLVQETFALVLAKPRRLRAQDDLGYLLQTLRNTFLTSRRAAARRIVAVEAPAGFEPIDRSPMSRPDEALAVRDVFAQIAALPAPFRDALMAVDVVGLGYAEAARFLDVKEATVTSRVHRARLQVARGMESGRSGVLVHER